MSNTIEIKLKIDKKDDWYKITCIVPNEEERAFFVANEAVTRILNKSSLIETWITTFENRFDSDLQQVGRELHSLFFQPFSTIDSTINRAVSENQFILINIQTTDHSASSLLWEILFFPKHGFIGISSRFQLIRTGEDRIAVGKELSSGPLKVLFMTCSPDGLKPLLDYEHEEEIVLKAVAEMKRKKEIEIDIAESGALEELERMLANKEYQVIHISGHGHYDEASNSGYLSMEYENGTHRPVSAREFADALIGKNSVQLLFLSACETGKETSQKTGLARLLTSQGIPMVIAMNYSVTDIAAIELTSSFYKHLSLKKSVCHALQAARKEYDLLGYGNFQWAIPAIYGRDEKSAIVDWQKPTRPIVYKPLTATIYGKVKHLVKGFVGRRRELRECTRQLRDADPPALCLTGAGGIGKSTLASRITDKFNHDGFIVVPLFGEMTLDIFICEVQKSLISAKEKEHINYLKDLLDNNDKFSYILSNIMVSCQLIFLFDNFEDNLKQSEEFKTFKNEYWEASFKTLIGHLNNTDSKVLITCRYTLPGISGSLVKQVQLKELSFAEMLKMIVYSMEFNQVTLSQAKEIYEVLGGNPKALIDLWEILSKTPLKWEEIKIKLKEVASDMRDFQLFEMLYSFLETDEKAFFRRISVFRKAVSIDGLRRQISKESNLDKYLKTLSDYGLVQEFKDEGNLLYQVHPLNRGFVKDEWWGKDEKENAHEVAAQYYHDREVFSIETLMEVSYHLQQAKQYYKMAEMINNHTMRLIKSGYLDECLYLNNIILDDIERFDKKFISLSYNNIGAIYDIKGKWDEALKYFLKSEKIHMEVGDKVGLADINNNIGRIFSNQGEWGKALKYLQNSEMIHKEIGNNVGLGASYLNIGLIYSRKSEWDKALEYYFKSEIIYKEVGDKANLASTYSNIGGIYSYKGDWDTALEYYLKSKAIHEEIGYKDGLGTINNNIGLIYSDIGEWDNAMQYFLKSEMIHNEIGDRDGLGHTYINIGRIYDMKGESSKALEYYLKSEEIFNEVGDKAGLGSTYNHIGLYYTDMGYLDKAISYYMMSGTIYSELGDIAGLGTSYNNIGLTYDKNNELDKALDYYWKSETIYKELGYKKGLGSNYNNIGNIYFKKGDWGKALENYHKSEAIRMELDDQVGLVASFFNIGIGFVANQEIEKGKDYIILSGYIALNHGLKVKLTQMSHGIDPIIQELGKEKFMEEGQKLYNRMFNQKKES